MSADKLNLGNLRTTQCFREGSLRGSTEAELKETGISWKELEEISPNTDRSGGHLTYDLPHIERRFKSSPQESTSNDDLWPHSIPRGIHLIFEMGLNSFIIQYVCLPPKWAQFGFKQTMDTCCDANGLFICSLKTQKPFRNMSRNLSPRRRHMKDLTHSAQKLNLCVCVCVCLHACMSVYMEAYVCVCVCLCVCWRADETRTVQCSHGLWEGSNCRLTSE